jgi:RimJ/RimL family protein N-acetyltransferase
MKHETLLKITTLLRNVDESDLEIFFEHQLDSEATAMAAFPGRDWDSFISHWNQNVLGNPINKVMTILVDDDRVAGYVASWRQDDRRLIAYWIGREYWGRGVASSALDEFITSHEQHRPLNAYVALSNPRSIRVLEKCGFRRVGESAATPDGVVEALYQLTRGDR